MKTLTILFIMIFSVSVSAYEFTRTAKGYPVRWYKSEITVYLDSSLEIIDESEIYTLVEDCYFEWLDHIDNDIILNFVYEDCYGRKGLNCVSMGYSENLADTYMYMSMEGVLESSSIIISDDVDWVLPGDSSGVDVKWLLLHEVGHFYGLTHDQNPESIMYPYYHQKGLTEDDAEGIRSLYALDDTRSSTEKTHSGLYMPGCSIGNLGKAAGSIFSLIF